MLWIKAWHVIFMVTWFAGLFYLPRLFVYHASATDTVGIERFRVMERRLFVLMTIGAVLTAAFGVWLLIINPALLQAGWMRAKLAARAAARRVPRLVLAAGARFRRGPECPCAGLVSLVQRAAVAAPDRHRAAGGRQALLISVPPRPVMRAVPASMRSSHQSG